MRFKTLIIVVAFLVSTNTFLNAQEIKPGKPNELDKQYTPDKNSSNPSANSSSSGSIAGKNNFVKFNFALLARSTCAFFYERKITDGISLQGGLGYCYNKDKAQNLVTEGDDIYLSDTKSSLSVGEIINNGYFKSGANPFLSASVRFSYNGLYSGWMYDNDDRNSYIDLGFRYYGHHYNLTSLNNNNYYNTTVSGGSNLSIRNFCYMLTWGYQIETDSKLVTSHEFYSGVGVRRSNYNMFTSTETYNSVTYVTSIVHTKSAVRETAVSPIFTIGYVLGFGF